MADSSSSTPSGKCPVAHGATSGEDTPASTPQAASKGRCPVAHGRSTATAATGASKDDTKRCPVMHGRPIVEESTAPKGKCPYIHGKKAASNASAPASGTGGVDVHAPDAPEKAADAVKAYFTQNYNVVATNGSAKPSAARVTLARRMQGKLGYKDGDLDYAGDDVTLMQGVGYPHDHAKYAPGNVVVDLGCGMGIDTRLAGWKVGPTGRAIGIDLSDGEVMVALSRAREQRLRNVDFRVADMEDLPFENESVDRVISNGGFCLVPNKPRAFGEIFRVLRPGGRIAIACTVRKQLLDKSVRWPVCMHTFMLQSDIQPVLTRLGFRNISVDVSNSRMDAQKFGEEDIEAAAKAAGVCTHAIRAQLKRRKQHGVSSGAGAGGAGAGSGSGEPRDESASDVGKRATVHKGSSEFSHLANFDMSDLCARVVIIADKPGTAGAAVSTEAVATTVKSNGWALGAASAVALVATAALLLSKRN